MNRGKKCCNKFSYSTIPNRIHRRGEDTSNYSFASHSQSSLDNFHSASESWNENRIEFHPAKAGWVGEKGFEVNSITLECRSEQKKDFRGFAPMAGDQESALSSFPFFCNQREYQITLVGLQ
jgi:hypothetical protein